METSQAIICEDPLALPERPFNYNEWRAKSGCLWTPMFVAKHKSMPLVTRFAVSKNYPSLLNLNPPQELQLTSPMDVGLYYGTPPVIVCKQEIKTIYYITAVLPNNTKERVPIINGMVPRIILTCSNNNITHREYNFTSSTPYLGKDTAKFRHSGVKYPKLKETNEEWDSILQRQVITSRATIETIEYVIEEPKPEETMKRPSEIKK